MNSDVIFDVGMHWGEDSEFYLKKGFKVVAIEANARLCDAVRDRLKSYISAGRLTILNVAVTERPGPVKFYINDQISAWGTTSMEWVVRNERLGTKAHEVSVEGVDFAEVLQRFGTPFYLKIDIEGADLLCLQALRKVQTRPKYVSIESTKTSWAALLREFALLNDLGYSKFKLVQQLSVEKQICPSPAKEGVYVNQRFQAGSSGPFGDEIAGDWITESEALRQYKKIFADYRLYGDDGLLRRLHQMIPRMPFFWKYQNRIKIKDVGWYDTHAAL